MTFKIEASFAKYHHMSYSENTILTLSITQIKIFLATHSTSLLTFHIYKATLCLIFYISHAGFLLSWYFILMLWARFAYFPQAFVVNSQYVRLDNVSRSTALPHAPLGLCEVNDACKHEKQMWNTLSNYITSWQISNFIWFISYLPFIIRCLLSIHMSSCLLIG